MDSALKRQMAPPLSLLVLGALTPRRHRVTIADENIEALDTSDSPDLVGLTVKADTAQRAWAIADGYRRRGTPVVFGGIFATTCPDENLPHADAVVLGEAETLWGEVLADAESGRLRTIYRSETPPDIALCPEPRWDLIAEKNYLYTNTLTIGRGCPWRCTFCYNSSPNLPRGYRAKPIPNILRELRSLKSRHVMFIDDNFIADPVFARDLLHAFLPLGLIWHTAVSSDIGHRDDLLDLLAASGCRSLFIGFETLSETNLSTARKRQNHVEDYARTVRKIHDRGMMVNASIVFGFDGDGPDVFRTTVDWLIAQQIESMTAHILTPYPGTELHARLTAEGRIFDRDLTHYNTSRSVFTPAGMTPQELESGYLWAYRHFYSWPNILRRLPRDMRRTIPYLLFNVGYRRLGTVSAALGAPGLMRTLGRLGARCAYSPWHTLALTALAEDGLTPSDDAVGKPRASTPPRPKTPG